MKKLIPVILIFSLAGCAQVSKWTNAQAWCAQDTECLADTKKYAEIGKQVAGAWNPAAGAGVGAGLTFLLLGVFGLRRKPKQ